MIFSNGRSFTTLDGKEFPFNPQSRESRRQANQAAQEHNAEVIRQREQQAGKVLSLDELLHGVSHPDSRTPLEKIQQCGIVRDNLSPPDTSDYAAKHLAELQANPGHTPDDRARTKSAIAYWKTIVKKQEAEQEAAQEAADRAAKLQTPKCQDAIKHAKATLDLMRWDPQTEQAELEQAQKRFAIAESGDHKAYWTAVTPYIEARDLKLKAAVEHQQQKVLSMAELAASIRENGRVPADVAKEMADEIAAKNKADGNGPSGN